MTAKEILKIASTQVPQDPKKKKGMSSVDRAFALGQAGAAGAGAIAGYRSPKLFHPKVISTKLSPTKFSGRLASGALGAATMAGLAWLPEVAYKGIKAIKGD